jgi:uncharacterized protein YjbI with pentapeptide repeats
MIRASFIDADLCEANLSEADLQNQGIFFREV